MEDKLRYVAVKPTASISKLRQKIWHLLDLPDYCDEIIVLKSDEERDLPLTALCVGNDPHHPYILEVWLPNNHMTHLKTINNNMLTMGDKESIVENNPPLTGNVGEEKLQEIATKCLANLTTCDDAVPLHKPRAFDNDRLNILHVNQKKSELSYRMSNSSLIFKLPGRKSAENFTNILLKIQGDLFTLSNKLSDLEHKINS